MILESLCRRLAEGGCIGYRLNVGSKTGTFVWVVVGRLFIHRFVVCVACAFVRVRVCVVCVVWVCQLHLYSYLLLYELSEVTTWAKPKAGKKSFHFHFISEFCEAQNGRVDNQPMRILATK